jgi:ABC-type branched-subunit amino acid transport system substrate-binding protein
MQVILDAISRSNGTRVDIYKKASATKISAAKSVVGKAISFDKNGDTMNKDITIEIVQGGAEVGLKVITVK